VVGSLAGRRGVTGVFGDFWYKRILVSFLQCTVRVFYGWFRLSGSGVCYLLFIDDLEFIL
jgi:hypothetical protein